jgi:hypothetical protein
MPTRTTLANTRFLLKNVVLALALLHSLVELGTRAEEVAIVQPVRQTAETSKVKTTEAAASLVVAEMLILVVVVLLKLLKEYLRRSESLIPS